MTPVDAVDLLNSDEAELPRKETDGPYGARLKTVMEGYYRGVEQLTATDEASQTIRTALPRIRELGQCLLSLHDALLRGRSAAAHSEMTSALCIVKPELSILRSHPLDQKRLGTLFRLREAPPSERVDRGGMFHIPFQLRHKVTPKRYSLLGIPMLYLGATLMVCWEELGRLSFDQLWVAAFRLKVGTTVRLLDFGYRPALMAAMLNEKGGNDQRAIDLAVAHAILWPIIAACSFPRRYPDAQFVEEYLIPQQIIAHLVETGDFDGIRYFSNRVHEYGSEIINLNHVYPAQPGPDEGYCSRLASLFELTPPMPVSMVTLLGPQVNRGTPLLSARQGVVEPYAGHRVAYQYTEFAKIESYLMEQSFSSVC